MTHPQYALTTLISEVFAEPDLAHSDVFRRMLQAGLQDLTQRLGSARSKPVNALISTIFAQTTTEAVTGQYRHVVESLRGSFPEITTMLENAEPDLTASAPLPREHWQKAWSNNPIERLNREIKRRADVVQIFPDRDSVTRLIGAVLQEQHEEWQYGERRYLSETSMRKLLHTLHDHTGTVDLTVFPV